MPTASLKITALVCSSLLALPFSSFAQTKSDLTPPFSEDETAGSGNAAEAALQRAVARAATVEFSPLSSSAWTEAAYFDTVAFSPDGQAQETPPNQTKPPAPSPSAPSLGDLGFPTEQTQANPAEQARLDKRSHMLKIHQRLGLITTVPMIATVLTSGLAGGRDTSSGGREAHAVLGSVTAGLYFTTAYYSIFAPKIPGTTAHGQTRLHKALAWIHGPGMVLTPILGAMAYQQKSRGERVHGMASAHGAVAAVTAAAYGLAILSVSIKF